MRHRSRSRGGARFEIPDHGCFCGVPVVSPIVKGFDLQRDAYRGLNYSQCSSMLAGGGRRVQSW